MTMQPDFFGDIAVPSAPDYAVPWQDLDARFEWIRAMRGTPQDPIHHAEGDVWIHTQMVAEAMAKLHAYRDCTDRSILYAAALLHDVAKPSSTEIGADGRVTSKGHSLKGAHLARRTLWRALVPFTAREHIVALIRHHQAPFWLLERDNPFELVVRISQTARCDWLAVLAEADARGRVCADQTRILDNVSLFVEYCKEHGCLDGPFEHASDHGRFLWFGSEGGARDLSRAKALGCGPEAFRSEVTLMSGFPGAGKDRWIAEHAADLPLVSLDQIRRELKVDPADDQGAVVQTARERARVLLRSQTSFVWNATNLSKRIRAQCIRLFADYGARVRIVYVEVPESVLHAQNANRPFSVPGHVLEALLDRWEIPDRSEAHEVVYVVGAEPDRLP